MAMSEEEARIKAWQAISWSGASWDRVLPCAGEERHGADEAYEPAPLSKFRRWLSK